MRAVAARRAILSRTTPRGTRAAVPAKRDSLRLRIGVWAWVFLLGADVAYELFAFIDGDGGAPTISQLVKGMVRAGGLIGAISAALVLTGAFIVLMLHWVLQVI